MDKILQLVSSKRRLFFLFTTFAAIAIVLLSTLTSASHTETTNAPSLSKSYFFSAEIKPQPLVQEKVSLNISKNIILGKNATVSGTVTSPTNSSVKVKAVSVEKEEHGFWQPLGRAIVRSKSSQGHFKVTFMQQQPGKISLRATVINSPKHLVDGGVSPTVVRNAAVPPLHAVTASYYTDYGQPIACGGDLTSHSLGVANKTLPCGTPVVIHYHGRYLTVPVIDRGPYVSGREYDLSGATAAAIHFNTNKGVDTIYANPE